MEDLMRIMELKQKGFFCSQILISLGLEDLEKDNPDLVRAARGLAGGLGFSRNVCGALTGGACLLGLHAGKGLPEEEDDPRLDAMVQEFVTWFESEYEPKYGSIKCNDILEGDPGNMKNRCPGIVVLAYEKTQELMVEHGIKTAEDE